MRGGGAKAGGEGVSSSVLEFQKGQDAVRFKRVQSVARPLVSENTAVLLQLFVMDESIFNVFCFCSKIKNKYQRVLVIKCLPEKCTCFI